jgi:hypothetical protein
MCLLRDGMLVLHTPDSCCLGCRQYSPAGSSTAVYLVVQHNNILMTLISTATIGDEPLFLMAAFLALTGAPTFQQCSSQAASVYMMFAF